ncbi:MAG: hypothetical protein ACD_37C00528G0003 [uncultured bacterium]|nr:MAG: hypothetical protein ACD_37C00528G0003 [uncultured bacterium]
MVIAKNTKTEKKNGKNAKRPSHLLSEKIADKRKATVIRTSGRSNGVRLIVMEPLFAILKAKITRAAKAAIPRSACLGIEKASVLIVVNKRGKKRIAKPTIKTVRFSKLKFSFSFASMF